MAYKLHFHKNNIYFRQNVTIDCCFRKAEYSVGCDSYIRLFADYLRTLELEGAIVERHSGDEFMAILLNGDEERMYMSKHSIKGVLNEFDPGIYQTNAYLLSGKEELNTILEKRKIRYAFQPIVARDAECMNTKISTIHRWGGLLALDDYGAGYSNEGNLLQINPDLVKMDIELVRNSYIDQNRQAMAKSLISYCHQRGILVLAEGVESLEELEYLVKLHVDLYQGYYLARPELEIQPLDRKVIEKMRELSQN